MPHNTSEKKICVKCDKEATTTNGTGYPVCGEHDLEKPNFLKEFRDQIGYSVI